MAVPATAAPLFPCVRMEEAVAAAVICHVLRCGVCVRERVREHARVHACACPCLKVFTGVPQACRGRAPPRSLPAAETRPLAVPRQV